MAAIFSRRANLYTQFILLGLGAMLLGLAGLVWVGPHNNYANGVGFTPPQPVPFSHQHHVSGLGLDCRYCHTAVEQSADAGIPATKICMTCHSQIWTNAAMLAPVRQSLAEHKPLQWNRVYTLPDYVYFDHSIHIAKGVGCTECHGPIGGMPMTWKASSLYMSWCLDCHRDPGPHLRPKAAVFDPHWQRSASTPSPAQLLAQYHIRSTGLDDCTVCHR